MSNSMFTEAVIESSVIFVATFDEYLNSIYEITSIMSDSLSGVENLLLTLGL